MLVRQLGQGVTQVIAILHEMHGNAKNAAVDTQLFVSADPVAVGSDQGQLVSAMPEHTSGGELGGSGGLADASRPDQRENAATFDDVVVAAQRTQGTISGTLGPGLRLACIKFLWQIIEQFARQLR